MELGVAAGRELATSAAGSFCLLARRLEEVDCEVLVGLFSLGALRLRAGVVDGAGVNESEVCVESGAEAETAGFWAAWLAA